jgi:hypothetical protein
MWLQGREGNYKPYLKHNASLFDISECIIGDITPHDPVSLKDKHKMESDAMKHLVSLLDPNLGRELYGMHFLFSIYIYSYFQFLCKVFGLSSRKVNPEKLLQFVI